jgi:hypothetical protein
MTKHVESNHFALLKQMVKDPNIASTKVPFDWEPNKKRQVFLHLQFLKFFFSTSKF